MRSVPLAGAAVLATLALAPSAVAAPCVRVGVYQDDPGRGLPALKKQVGKGVTAISTYMTAGKPISPKLIKAANKNRASLVVTWQPDAGRDGSSQPAYRLSAVAKGKYDKSLKALVKQLRGVKKGAVLRPMPEMNTPWYPWSGTANKNAPGDYVKAWNRVRKAVRGAKGGKRIKMLWSPYSRSIPDTGPNAIRAYFPGAGQVDAVVGAGCAGQLEPVPARLPGGDGLGLAPPLPAGQGTHRHAPFSSELNAFVTGLVRRRKSPNASLTSYQTTPASFGIEVACRVDSVVIQPALSPPAAPEPVSASQNGLGASAWIVV